MLCAAICCSMPLCTAVITVFIPTRASSAHKRLSQRARANACPLVSVYTYPCVLKERKSGAALGWATRMRVVGVFGAERAAGHWRLGTGKSRRAKELLDV